MRPISVADMIEVDRLMVNEYGITLLQMMENAGRSLAATARRMLGGSTAGRRVLVLVGKGNNGGGLVAARHLANAGAHVTVALAVEPGELGEVPGRQLHTLRRMGIDGSDRATSQDNLSVLLPHTDLVLDALVGYSLSGAPREPVAGFIRAANAAPVPRLSLDIPSGLDGDSGIPRDPCLRADATLTLAWPKVGLLSENARPYVGDLYLADIGVPDPVYRALGVDRGQVFARGPIVGVEVQGADWQVAQSSEEVEA
ncbi:MAG: NAD(P)H-hydrate epimerase [Chloroflexota bacterium]|nr:NAD(P)H-hydrate epimerase [Chloroflexota bacterium]